MASGAEQPASSQYWYRPLSESQDNLGEARAALFNMLSLSRELVDPRDIIDSPQPAQPTTAPSRDALLVLLPLLIILSSLLFFLLLFLVCVLFIRRRRGVVLRDNDGPIDMSREELIDGEGGFEGVEERWLESVDEETRRNYGRAKDYQLQYPPNSLPTDITLSQFLSIQEKGVSAWSFEPDYESNASLLVHARTEITFLPDPSSESCVQSNLPLPKINEVYYWEVKMFDLPPTTSVAIGLATKPYPVFRMPGLCKYSVAYHSNGDKVHNFPFTAQQYGPSLKEGDVLGVGYRPRTGTVFYTRNGRKLDDAFIGLTRWNLFPTVGANGPCSLHVNLGQSGFVFIEANVKKWGLAPSVGTLAPPPAYGSERGSILLEAGGGIIPNEGTASSPHRLAAAPSSRRSRRSRRPQPHASPLRNDAVADDIPRSPPPPITPIEEEVPEATTSSSDRYISPTDAPFHTAVSSNLPPSPPAQDDENGSQGSSGTVTPTPSRSMSPLARTPVRASEHSRHNSAAEMVVRLHPPPESPLNPPEPVSPDEGTHIHLRALTPASQTAAVSSSGTAGSGTATPPPPAYSPLDAYRYQDGVHVDLPAEVITAALEGGTFPSNVVGSGSGNRHERHRSRRDRRS